MQIPLHVTRVDQVCHGCYEAVVDPPGTLCDRCRRPQVGDTISVEEPVEGRMWLQGYQGYVTMVDGDVLMASFILPSRVGLWRQEEIALGVEEVEVVAE